MPEQSRTDSIWRRPQVRRWLQQCPCSNRKCPTARTGIRCHRDRRSASLRSERKLINSWKLSPRAVVKRLEPVLDIYFHRSGGRPENARAGRQEPRVVGVSTVIPVSYRYPGYTCIPSEVLGPPMASQSQLPSFQRGRNQSYCSCRSARQDNCRQEGSRSIHPPPRP